MTNHLNLARQFNQEVERGARFGFGKNWTAFLSTVTEERIREAERSIKDFNIEPAGKTWLDIGSGSGLFSLAARRLGAIVHSFDYDPDSVACTKKLKTTYRPNDPDWKVEHGSVLDESYMRSLGKFEAVYSWGVLHHTGQMWKALENACIPVKQGGYFVIAIYNDEGMKSKRWRKIKELYCSGPAGQAVVLGWFLPYFFLMTVAKSVRRGTNEFSTYKKNRGMSIVHDWFDWLGGLPFEVAKPQEIVKFCEDRGFKLLQSNLTTGLGNNQFVLQRVGNT